MCKNLSINNIEIIETGVKEKFKLEFPVILNDRGFELVESLAIIRDADHSKDSAVDSGMLENLALDTVSEHPVKICADEYIENLRQALSSADCMYKFPNNEHKAKLHAYLSGMEKLVTSLGLAAQKGYFDLNSDALNDIKNFIRNM